MKNIYKNSMLKQSMSLWLVSLFVLLFTNVSVAQVFKPFQQRTSSQAPGDFKNKQIYNLRGDFKMIGNTNLRVSGGTGADSESNSNTSMVLVDEDGVSTTTNSSRAELTLPATCTNIVYAGLYWSGRRDNNNDASISTNNHQTNATNIGSTGLNLTISSIADTGSNEFGKIVYTLTNASSSIYYEFQFGTNNNPEVKYRTSATGTYTIISSDDLLIPTRSDNDDRRTATLLEPVSFTIGSQIVTIHSLQRRNRYTNNNQITDANVLSSDRHRMQISVLTNNAGSSNKINAKIRKGSTGNYTPLVADDYVIGSSGQDGIFTAYKDITKYVQDNGVGDYWVADLDLNAGDGSSVGYFGGWGMVVIYENPTMKWRDITVFDGYAYVADGNYYNLSLAGFHAAQDGAVNVTMGMMAGEGDRSISGDAFRIRNAANTSWIDLVNGTNGSANNFFDSSIITDGTRTPSLSNNTGLDIVKFDLPNSSKNLIANNQKATKFRYANNGGGDEDTYVIYNVVFAVDAYVPEAEGVNLPQQIYVPADSSTAAQTIVNPSAVAARMANLQPGDEVTMRMSLYNYGNENIKDAKIDVNVPNAMRLIKAQVVNKTGQTHIDTSTNSGNSVVNYNQAFWINPVTPNYTAPNPLNAITSAVAEDGGVLRWNIGMIPTQKLPAGGSPTEMSYLEYTLKVTNDCAKLRTSNNECVLKPEISGSITGNGVNSNTPLNPNFIIGYNTGCGTTPIYGNTKFVINPSSAFLAKCSEVFKGDELLIEYFCNVPTGATIPRATIANYYPTGTKFYYNNPSTPNFDSSTFIVGDFTVTLQPLFDTATVPNQIGQEERFYAILPGTTNFACYNNIHVLVTSITSKPRISVFESVCSGSNYSLPVTLSDVGTAKNLTLAYFNSATSTIPLATPPNPTAVGVHKYWVAEASTGGNGQICYGEKVEFSIVIKGCSMKVNPQIYNKFKRP